MSHNDTPTAPRNKTPVDQMEKRLREALGDSKFDKAMKPYLDLVFETGATVADLTDVLNATLWWMRQYGPKDKLPALDKQIAFNREKRRILNLPAVPLMPFSAEHLIIEARAAVDQHKDGTASAYLLMHQRSPVAEDLAFMKFDGKDRGEAIKSASSRVMVSKQRAIAQGLYDEKLLADLPSGDVELPAEAIAHLQKVLAKMPTPGKPPLKAV